MIPQNIILGGDFNSFLNSLDGTGARYFSPALENLVQCWGLIDSWANTPAWQIFTYYAPQNASQIDLIYMSSSIVS
jgi:hypothetical protein